MKNTTKRIIAFFLIISMCLNLAACKKQYFTVTFDTDGGTTIESQQVEKGKMARKPAPDPTKDGYTFVEWQLDGVIFNFETTAIEKDITLKAVWSENPAPAVEKFTVTFDSDGGSAVASQEIVKGQKATEPAAPTKDGYTFVEWQLDGVRFDFDTAITGNITLKAVWAENSPVEKDQYTVSFANTGDAPIEPQTVNKNTCATEPTKPSKNGYIFVEWQVDGKEYFFDEPVNADITVTGVWDVASEYTEISTTSQLLELFATGGSGKYILTQDLDFTGVTVNGSAATFGGVLDGNGHTISNITATESTNKKGIFFKDVTETGVIRNLIIQNSTYASGGEAGAFITAYAWGGAVFSNIEFYNVSVDNQAGAYAALIVGDNANDKTGNMKPIVMKRIVVKNTSDYEILGKNYTGGLYGYVRNQGALEFNHVYVSTNVRSKINDARDQVAGILAARINAGNSVITVNNAVIKGTCEATKNVGAVLGTSVSNTTLNATNVFVSNYSGIVGEGNKVEVLVGNPNGMTINATNVYYANSSVSLTLDSAAPATYTPTQGTGLTDEQITDEWFAGSGLSTKFFKRSNNTVELNREAGEIIIVGFSIITESVKLRYLVGEELDLSDLVVKANYSDMSSIALPSEQYEVDTTEYNKDAVGTYSIKITFNGETKSFNVTVVDMDSIDADTMNIDTQFLVGETPNFNALVVRGNLTDGGFVRLDKSEYTISHEIDSNVAGVYTVTVTFKDMTDTFDVVVSEKKDVEGASINLYVDQGATDSEQASATKFKTMKNALAYIKKSAALAGTTWTSEVKKIINIADGVYFEKLTIETPNIILIGESREGTILDYNAASGDQKPEGGTWGTQGSASVSVKSSAVGFMAANLTFSNSFDYNTSPYGDGGSQAVALVTEADKVVFTQVNFKGYQDTLYAKSGRQWYYEVYIEGHVDFIFGNGGPVFIENSIIKSLARNTGVIATNKGVGPDGAALLDYAYVFYNNTFTYEEGVPAGSVDLGRPWARDARIAYINNTFDAHISARGWVDMSGNQPENAFFYEYGNKNSEGSDFGVTQKGKALTEEQAALYTKDNVFAQVNGAANYGSAWDYEAALAYLVSLIPGAEA